MCQGNSSEMDCSWLAPWVLDRVLGMSRLSDHFLNILKPSETVSHRMLDHQYGVSWIFQGEW